LIEHGRGSRILATRRPGRRRAWRHVAASVAGVTLAGTALAACGTSNAATGPVTLNFYLYPDGSGATQQAINNCDAQSHGAYKISYKVLPQASDAQRQKMLRRLAAHDPSMDILGVDVTWECEFAQAGWIVPWTVAYKAEAEDGTLKPMLQTATWKGQLVAVPDNTNTQLLWYRSDLVPTPPTTWAQMIADAEQLAKEGKHTTSRSRARSTRA
jgi:multiple sugar transport system substrate-binding protein